MKSLDSGVRRNDECRHSVFPQRLLFYCFMSGPTLRLANFADAQSIALMSRELIETGLSGWSWDPKRVARAIQAKDTTGVVAVVRDHLTGFAIMNFGD